MEQFAETAGPSTTLPQVSCRDWWRWRTSCGFLYGKPHTWSLASAAWQEIRVRSGRDDNSVSGFRIQLSFCNRTVIPHASACGGTGVFMGRRPTQGDEKRLSCSNCSLWTRYPPLCHPERSRGTCGSADLSWKCFSTGAHPDFLPRSTGRTRATPPSSTGNRGSEVEGPAVRSFVSADALDHF